ncbi:MAG: DegT/DnrJ/EryC1/StrS aminotransferase family protein [Actinomycetota bacterium]|nr:DegT/DnrJ/EryC1/StrS aminotransferase family protein [Actinomycetota bacterium]
MTLLDLGAQRRRIGPAINRAIDRVVDHERFIMGPEVAEFEDRLADACGATHAVSCASGTDALLLTLLALGAGPGRAVLVPSFTFVATAEVVSLVGATPVLVDVEEGTANIDPVALERGLAAVDASGLVASGIIAVDLFGQPADYRRIAKVASERGLWVLADAAQSFGATLDGRPVGTLAPVTATSFFPSKPLGCYGDGGAVLTSDSALADHVRSLRIHGKGASKYDAARVGLNSRLDTIQAAVLLEKLAVLDEEIERRQRLAERYSKELSHVVQVPEIPADVTSAWAQYTVRLDDRDAVAGRLKADGVPTAVYYPKPLHRQTAYESCPQPAGGLPVSDALSRRVLSLPMHPYLSDRAQERVIASVRRAVAP